MNGGTYFVAAVAAILVAPCDAFTAMAPPRVLSQSRAMHSYTQQSMVASLGEMDQCDPLTEECGYPETNENSIVRNVPALLAVGASVGLAAAGLLTHDPHTLTAAVHSAAGIPKNLWAGYEHVLADFPIRTKALTSATVYTIGDIIAQRTAAAGEDEDIELDLQRTLRSMLAGLIGHGPMSHLYYNLSENLFQNTLHLTAWWSFMPKIALDQALFGPIWNNTYILLLGLMKFDKIDTIFDDMRRTTVPLVLEGLKLWPFVHCVTYGLIPVENRLLWVDAVEILWVTILATKAAEAKEEESAPAPAQP